MTWAKLMSNNLLRGFTFSRRELQHIAQLRAGPGLRTRIFRSVATTKQPVQAVMSSAPKSLFVRVIILSAG